MNNTATLDFLNLHNDTEIHHLHTLFSKHALFSNTFEPSNFKWNERSIDNIFTSYLKEYEQGKSAFIVLYQNEKPIGYMYLLSNTTGTGQKRLIIDDIFVDEEYRGSGYGSKLFEEAHNIARKTNCDAICVSSWLDNTDACNFYKSLGMKEKIIEYHLDV